MTNSFDEAEFWLPSQFLSDDDWLIEKEYMKNVASNDRKGFTNTKDVFGGPYDFPSDLSSPEESASTETESDEDDYSFLAGLTHQMARSSLHADDRSSKGWPSKPISRSPQCQFGNGCGCKPAAGCVATPQATWDMLYATAGEVAKMKLDEQAASYGSHLSGGGPFLGPTRSNFAPNRSTTYSPPEIALYYKIQALQLRQQQQQLLKRQQQQGAAWGVQGGSHLYHNHPSHRVNMTLNGFRHGCQALQQQKHSGPGMPAVFLDNQPARRERNGTGVFLPRRAGTPPADTRKKSGGSTVILPERVVQSLNLNLIDVSGSHHSLPHRPAYNDGDLRVRSGNFLGGYHDNQSFRSNTSREVGLPQEWTY